MLHNFLIVLQQVSVLFLLMMIGYWLGNKKHFSDETIRGLDFVILNLALPCTIIRAFQMEHDASMLQNFLLCIALSGALHLLFFAVAFPFSRKIPDGDRGVYLLSSTLTNCSFMGFPLQAALLGTLGILYSSGYVFIMNLFTFTVGYYLFTGDRKSISPKQIITRPAILGTLIGLALFLLNIPLPDTLATVVDHIANLTVPLPMFIIGYHLSHADFGLMFRNRLHWKFSALRLVVLPVLGIVLMSLLPLEKEVFLSLAVCAACPTATAVTILASRFTDKGALSAELGAMQTLLSLLTLPVMLAFATFLI